MHDAGRERPLHLGDVADPYRRVPDLLQGHVCQRGLGLAPGFADNDRCILVDRHHLFPKEAGYVLLRDAVGGRTLGVQDDLDLLLGRPDHLQVAGPGQLHHPNAERPGRRAPNGFRFVRIEYECDDEVRRATRVVRPDDGPRILRQLRSQPAHNRARLVGDDVAADGGVVLEEERAAVGLAACDHAQNALDAGQFTLERHGDRLKHVRCGRAPPRRKDGHALAARLSHRGARHARRRAEQRDAER